MLTDVAPEEEDLPPNAHPIYPSPASTVIEDQASIEGSDVGKSLHLKLFFACHSCRLEVTCNMS